MYTCCHIGPIVIAKYVICQRGYHCDKFPHVFRLIRCVCWCRTIIQYAMVWHTFARSQAVLSYQIDKYQICVYVFFFVWWREWGRRAAELSQSSLLEEVIAPVMGALHKARGTTPPKTWISRRAPRSGSHDNYRETYIRVRELSRKCSHLPNESSTIFWNHRLVYLYGTHKGEIGIICTSRRFSRKKCPHFSPHKPRSNQSAK